MRDATREGPEFFASTRAIARSPITLGLPGLNGTNDLWTPELVNQVETSADQGFTGLRPQFTTESSGWLIQVNPGQRAGGYATVGLDQFVDVNPVGDNLQLKLRLEADPCTNSCARERMPINRVSVFVDPQIHTNHQTFEGVICPNHPDGDLGCRTQVELGVDDRSDVIDAENGIHYATTTVDIDTTDLEPGVHVALIAVEMPMLDYEDEITDEFNSTLTGLLVHRFIVD